MASNHSQNGSHAVVLCRCAMANLIAPPVLAAASEALQSWGGPVVEIADLCELSAAQSPLLREISQCKRVTILACRNRAVRWLFHAAGAPLPEGADILDLRECEADDVASALDRALVCSHKPSDGCHAQAGSRGGPQPQDTPTLPSAALDGGTDAPATPKGPTPWMPWFPVLDYSRCTNCMQCLSFCMFGVYGVSVAGKVEVQNPRQCKNNCPACARICPSLAIMFPKFADGPISGLDIRPEDLQRPDMKVDLTALSQGDIYAKMRQRGLTAGMDPLSERGGLGRPPRQMNEPPHQAGDPSSDSNDKGGDHGR